MYATCPRVPPSDRTPPGSAARALPLAFVAALFACVGFLTARAHSAVTLPQQFGPALSAPRLTTAVAGAALSSLALGTPALAMEYARAPATPHTMELRQPAPRVAITAEAPPVEAIEPSEYAQLAVGVLLLPVLGYISWTFGTRKAAEDREEAKSKFDKETAEGNFVKISPSGIPTIRGLPMASDAGWKLQADDMRKRGIQGMEAGALKAALGEVTILDVRPAERFKESAIPGSLNVPLFQPIMGWSPFKIARRLQFAAFGVPGTEYNPNFMADLAQAMGKTDKGKVVFLDDSVRGTLLPTTAFPDGKPGHALLALYLALNAGYDKEMVYVEGGIGAFNAAGGETYGADP